MEAAGAGPTVLVVDDDPALRLLCRVNLELEHYRVLEAATLEEATAALVSEPIDVVLLDIHVGREDGRLFLRDIRAQGNAVPVALFTGSSEVTEDESELAGAVLPKPFALEELTAVVGRLSGR